MKNFSYGQRLQWARERAGLTQQQLASISKVKQGTISKIERGDQLTSAYDSVLGFHLNVNPYWLSTGEGAADGCVYSDKELQLIRAYRLGQGKAKESFEYWSSEILKGIDRDSDPE